MSELGREVHQRLVQRHIIIAGAGASVEPVPSFKAFSHERGVVRTRFSIAATLFAAGEVPAMVRKLMKSAFKIL